MAYEDLKQLFDGELRYFPDLLEPYTVLLADAQSQDETEKIMRRALAETIKQRYPK